jgi:simple sugar transport system ATP-binding protein
VIDGISFDVKSGTILGIAGVDGNGQTELVELAVGMRTASDGVVTYLGKDITRTDVRYRLGHGIGYVPEDRQSKGLVGAFTLKENLVLGYERDKRFSHRGVVDWKEVDGYAEDVIKGYDVRCQGKEEHASALSGGNQQKLIIGRVLESNPTMIVAAQPTRGVDIGAVEYIHRKLIDMRNKGKAILLVSADLDEIMELSDEIAVVYEGRIVSMAQNGAYTKTELGSFMTGARSGGEK